MSNPLSQLLSEAVRFGAVGVVNTLVTLVIIYMMAALGADPYAANAVGYGFGMTSSFLLNRSWTFSREFHSTNKAMVLRFLSAFLLSYAVNLLALHFLIHAGFDEYVAQILSMPFFTASFFLLSKFMVFPGSVRATGQALQQREAS